MQHRIISLDQLENGWLLRPSEPTPAKKTGSFKHRFFRNCVGWPRGKVDDLDAMVEKSTDITRQTFMRHVDREWMADFARESGYERRKDRGLTLAEDWHVSYHRSALMGLRVYFFRYSGFEYVFVPPEFDEEQFMQVVEVGHEQE